MANTLKYTDALGPAFVDGTTGFTFTIGVQGLLASRTLLAPDQSGTIAVTTDITGTNSGTNTGDVTLVTFGSSPAAAGASISGQALTLQPADATHAGGVSVSAQTFAGVKTFSSSPVVPTATAGDNSTNAASTAYADRFNGDPQFSIPTTGGTVSPTAVGNEVHVFINPAGTLLALTLTLPTGTIKGQRLYATFTQIITGLTVTGTNVDTKGKAAPSAAAVGDTLGYAWDSVSTKWNRFV